MYRWLWLAAVVGSVAAFAVGYDWGKRAYWKLYNQGLQAVAEEAQRQHERAQRYEDIAAEHWEAYVAARDKPASVVTERVYVKADCLPAKSDPDGSVGAGDGNRAALHPEVVERVIAVTDSAEADLGKCKAMLDSLREKVRVHNAAVNSK